VVISDVKAARLVAVAGLGMLAACTTTLPLSGRMERTNETFSGTVSGSGYREGTGQVTLVSSLNTRCSGNFTYTSRRRGEGVLACNDGRTGAFRLSGAGSSGTGTGELNGHRFNFVFGPAT
jgi:hypothetical protein